MEYSDQILNALRNKGHFFTDTIGKNEHPYSRQELIVTVVRTTVAQWQRPISSDGPAGEYFKEKR